jgi:hypothetical protein
LASLASDCKLLAHVVTQAPYATVVIIVSMLFGTLPIGRDAWPNIVGILLGTLALFAFVFGICVPITSPTGRFDIFTLMYMKYKGPSSDLYQLQADTIAAYGGAETEQKDPVGADDGVVPNELDVDVDMDMDDAAANGKADHDEPVFSNDVTA